MTRGAHRLSLQTRLYLSIIAIVVLAAVFTYLFINHAVGEAFSTFTVRTFTQQDRLLVRLLIAYHSRTGSFEGVVDVLESTVPVPLLLINPEGDVVYPSNWSELGHRLTDAERAQGEVLTLPDGAQWTLVPYRYNPQLAEYERLFFLRIRRSLWLAGLVAAAAGFLIALLLRRQVARPLNLLEEAARRIAQGDLEERVPIETADEFGHVARSFNEMAESLESSERAKRRMISDIAHELRTPITVVRSALEGLRDGLIDPSQETFTSLHRRILLLTRLVGDLHQLALADAGRLTIEVQPTRISTIVEGIVETIGAQAEDADLLIETALAPNLPYVAADPHRIEQVLINLLANAMRHTPANGRIRIEANEVGQFVHVRVCDSGPGVLPEDLPYVFDRFYRADPSRAPGDMGADEGSSGLGLPIAKALVEAHGGRIWVENAREGGACVEFTLPCTDSPFAMAAGPTSS